MSYNHSDSHDHHHHNTCNHHNHYHGNHGQAFIIGILLNSIFIVFEIIYGLKSNSLALLADAGHNISDVLGLFMAWGAILLAKRQPSERYTYGLQSSSIIAALGNAILLLLVVGGIIWEALQRLNHPEAVAGSTVITVASLGILVNGISAFMFMAGNKEDLNIRGAFLHMAADAVISIGVVIAGLVILQTGWLWLDPIISITISIVIIVGTIGLLKDSVNLALHAVPSNIETAKVKEFLKKLPHVKEVHDLHIWAMSTTETALSAHLLIPNGHPGDVFISNLNNELHKNFNISHSTIQIEIGDSKTECILAPDNVI